MIQESRESEERMETSRISTEKMGRTEDHEFGDDQPRSKEKSKKAI